MVYKRIGKNREDDLLIILNVTPEVRRDWTIQVQGKAVWKEIFNSDAKEFYGTGDVFNPAPATTIVDKNNDMHEISCHLPALGAVIFQ